MPRSCSTVAALVEDLRHALTHRGDPFRAQGLGGDIGHRRGERVRGDHFQQHVDHLGVGEGEAAAQAGKGEGFGQRAQHHQCG